jgi:hypothetical protein
MQWGVLVREAYSGLPRQFPKSLRETAAYRPHEFKGRAPVFGKRPLRRGRPAVGLTGDRNQRKNPNDFWSEWQDSNLRPLRPERSECFLSR